MWKFNWILANFRIIWDYSSSLYLFIYPSWIIKGRVTPWIWQTASWRIRRQIKTYTHWKSLPRAVPQIKNTWMFLDCERNPENRREPMQTQAVPRLNPQPFCCEWSALTTAPQCRHSTVQILEDNSLFDASTPIWSGGFNSISIIPSSQGNMELCLLPPAGKDRYHCGESAPDNSRPRFPPEGDSQKSPPATCPETHQLHSAGKPAWQWTSSFCRISRMSSGLVWNVWSSRNVTVEVNILLNCVFLDTFQRLDIQNETIELVHSNPTETHELPRRVPKDTPRYHFFLYKHSHEGLDLESIGMDLMPVYW